MSFNPAIFPNLHSANHQDTSPPDRLYNCLAWAAGRNDQWWDWFQPKDAQRKYYWPVNVPRDDEITSLVLVYESEGYAICADGTQEQGFEKIALYADGKEYMHAARQLESGKWTSKIGELEDIKHDAPEDLIGPAYGQIYAFMQRKR